ncbi:MAG: hypothetical protein LBD08_04935 [Treponema sp.]|jgi:hypothetical protein|nr:hypothetical protein [Treponema sp.]
MKTKQGLFFVCAVILASAVFSLTGCTIEPIKMEDGKSLESAKTLTPNTWTNSSIASSNGEQWFKFSLTANPQFLHITFGTLTDVYVEMYDEYENKVVAGLNIDDSSGSIGSIRWYFGLYSPVDIGDMVYVNVKARSRPGTYRIAFNTTSYAPGTAITILTPNNWANGNLSSPSDEQWFKFSPASGGTHYIHVNFGTLSGLYIRLYSANDMLGEWVNLSGNNKSYTTPYLSSGTMYYVRVQPNSNSGSGSGTFEVMFSDSRTVVEGNYLR